MNTKYAFGALALSLLCSAGHARSTGVYRTTAESDHFFITAERGRGDAAMEAATRLEAAFSKLTDFFDFTPEKKINAVLIDDEDYSNGFAYAANSWVVLYLPPARFDLRGATAWIPNVSAHELAHVISLRKMGVTSRFLGVEAFASLGFFRGRADASVSHLPDNVPPWLAEGLAQYASMHCGFDTLDARREMLLREAWKAGALIPLKAMEDFSGDARQGELIYNQGFHLVDFIYRTRGREAVNAMLKAWDKEGYRGAFQKGLGAAPEAIYAEWLAELDENFRDRHLDSPAEKGRPATVYRVETAPMRDAARDILYFLSSDPNDFGITHLYARQGGRTRRIRRNVETTPQLADDGSLLFAAVRIDPSNGARTGDLYRYHPDQGLKRITRHLRVFAGAQAGQNLFALVYYKGRTRLAHLKNGAPDRWIDAPAGSEFLAVAAGGDSALYLTVVRGNNADIFRLALGTGLLAPLEASPHNEIDPQLRDGRLYFSSDVSGEYAVYTREGGSLRRHTPEGVSAFRPFAAADSLWYSAYEPDGFHIVSAGIAGDSGIVTAPPDTTNRPFPAPNAISLKNLKRDRAGKEWLGYYATLGYAVTPSVDVSNFFGSEVPFRLNPCGQQAYAGGGSLWTDPAQRSSLSLTLLGAQCVDGTPDATPYLPQASLTYVSTNFTPDLIFNAEYQALRIGRLDPDLDRMEIGSVHTFQVAAAADYHLGDYFSNTGFVQIGGTVANLRQGETEGGGGLAIGNTFGLLVFEPGADLANQGLYADATVAASNGAAVFAGDAGLFTNVNRALFLGAQVDAQQTTESPDAFDGGFLFSADTRFPLGVTLGSAGYRGMFLESVFLRAGYSRRWNTSPGIGFNLGNTLRPLYYGVQRAGAAASPVPQIQSLTPQTVRLGLRLKAISPGSRVVYWDVNWEAPPAGLKDGYFSVSLSL